MVRSNWNVGIMENWKKGLWDIGMLGKWSAEIGTIKFKKANILNKTQYSITPLFHYSMVEAKYLTPKIRSLSRMNSNTVS